MSKTRAGPGQKRAMPLQDRGEATHAYEEQIASLETQLQDLQESTRSIEAARQQWTDAVDAMPEPVFLHDSEYRIVRANTAYAERAGSLFKDLIGKRYFEIFPKLDGPLLGCARVVAGRVANEQEEVKLRTGEIFVSYDRTVRNTDGSFLYSVHVLRDVTERRRAEEALLSYEHIVSATPDHMAVVNRDYTYRIVNNSYLEAHGKSRDEIVGHTAADLVGAATFDRLVKPNLNKAFNGEIAQYRAWIDFEGARRRFMSVTYSPFMEGGETTGVLVSARDVTELMRAELAVRESEAQYANVFENSLNGIALHEIVTDSKGKPVDYVFLTVNEAFEQLTGLAADDVIGKRVTEVIPGIEDDGFIETYGRVALTGEPVRFEQFASPLNRYYDVAAFSPREGQFTTLFSDITERTNAEAALRDRERTLRSISSAAHDAIIMLDESGAVSYWNEASTRMFGYTVKEAVGENLAELVIPKRFRERHNSGLARFTKTGRGTVLGKPLELLASRKDGSEFPVELSVSGVQRGDDWHAVGIVRDITERKRLEEERQEHVEKLQEALIQTIYAIGLTIEKRDPYTAGHQRRVAELAAAIAREMGLSREQVDGIYMGGLIHDIGKIFIPSEILNRPGVLSASELELIKSHPEVGYEIIKGVEFEWPVADMILQHHERLDGSGYPRGLKQAEITLEARILAVADVVEAISSHRPYRPSLGVAPALEELMKNRSIFYEPDAVDACITLFKENKFGLP